METAIQIDSINQILKDLSEPAIKEVQDFASYLREKQRKHDAFVEETLKAEKESTATFDSVDDAMEYILNAEEN